MRGHSFCADKRMHILQIEIFKFLKITITLSYFTKFAYFPITHFNETSCTFVCCWQYFLYWLLIVNLYKILKYFYLKYERSRSKFDLTMSLRNRLQTLFDWWKQVEIEVRKAKFDKRLVISIDIIVFILCTIWRKIKSIVSNCTICQYKQIR